MTTQDPELSAALGWPGGISDPVLDRTRLLQMVAALRLASQQALKALEISPDVDPIFAGETILALRAALAQPSARQVSPAAFAEIVKSREEIVGIPVYWAEWPNKETS